MNERFVEEPTSVGQVQNPALPAGPDTLNGASRRWAEL